MASRIQVILQAGRELILHQNLVRKPLVMKPWSVDGRLRSIPRRIQLITLSSVAEIIIGPPATG